MVQESLEEAVQITSKGKNPHPPPPPPPPPRLHVQEEGEQNTVQVVEQVAFVASHLERVKVNDAHGSGADKNLEENDDLAESMVCNSSARRQQMSDQSELWWKR